MTRYRAVLAPMPASPGGLQVNVLDGDWDVVASFAAPMGPGDTREAVPTLLAQPGAGLVEHYTLHDSSGTLRQAWRAAQSWIRQQADMAAGGGRRERALRERGR